MTVEYAAAPAVATIAERLIPAHHAHLEDVRIEYVFRSKHADEGGKAVWGKARKISGLNAFLSRDADEGGAGDEDYFVIEIAADVWSALSGSERIALVDHELAHCKISYDDKTGEAKLGIAPHDVEEFKDVISRHGLWRPDLTDFLRAAKAHMASLDAS